MHACAVMCQTNDKQYPHCVVYLNISKLHLAYKSSFNGRHKTDINKNVLLLRFPFHFRISDKFLSALPQPITFLTYSLLAWLLRTWNECMHSFMVTAHIHFSIALWQFIQITIKSNEARSIAVMIQCILEIWTKSWQCHLHLSAG